MSTVHTAVLGLGAVAVAAALIRPVTGKPIDAPPPGRLAFTVCDGDKVDEVQPPGTPWTILACAKPCPDWHRCAVPETPDASGRPRQRVAFTMDGMGGMIRWTTSGRPATAGVLVHGGGSGTDWRDGDDALWGPLLDDGLRVIGVRWHPGIIDPATGSAWGWLAKTDTSPDLYSTSSAKVAAVIRFAHDELVPAGVPFGLVGTSNGALATLAAVAWHNLDPIVDYHLLNSGALIWDMGARCAAQAGRRPPHGLCENDPMVDCRTDQDCGGEKDRCAWPEMSNNLARRNDYRFGTGNACMEGQSNTMFDRASFKDPAADLSYDHPVDFVVAEGRGGPENDDTLDGHTWQMGMTFRALTTTDPRGKRWFDLHGYGHGQGLGHPDHTHQLSCGLRTGLGLPPCQRR